jgi:hypothetical protein
MQIIVPQLSGDLLHTANHPPQLSGYRLHTANHIPQPSGYCLHTANHSPQSSGYRLLCATSLPTGVDRFFAVCNKSSIFFNENECNKMNINEKLV